jgi:histidinol-phosphate/aromatic aminotransferase/cobyric acid decarboxylase-like protein
MLAERTEGGCSSQAIRLVQGPFACTTPVQLEASACLEDLATARDCMDRVMADRDALIAVRRRSPAIAHVFASETNFVFCRVADPSAFSAALAAWPHVLVADASRHVPGCVKISPETP